MSTASAHAVYTALIEFAGANTNGRQDFVEAWPTITEYRFGGLLGSGGKFWISRNEWFVTCYPEDETPERTAVVGETNAVLAGLRDAALARGESP